MKMSFEVMIAIYNMFSVAEDYIVGFTRNHKLYMARIYAKHLPKRWLKVDYTSHKKGYQMKAKVYIPAHELDEMIENGVAVLLGDESMLKEVDKYNKGDNFERIIVERFTTEVWRKNKIPFYKDGDMTYENCKIQIKFNGAELTTLPTIRRMLQKVGDALVA
jgi:hypothetical protein